LYPDVLDDSRVYRIVLTGSDFGSVVEAHERFGLDFDDAYQYAAAEKYNLVIVSFDTDFDRTDLGRKTPAQALQRLS